MHTPFLHPFLKAKARIGQVPPELLTRVVQSLVERPARRREPLGEHVDRHPVQCKRNEDAALVWRQDRVDRVLDHAEELTLLGFLVGRDPTAPDQGPTLGLERDLAAVPRASAQLHGGLEERETERYGKVAGDFARAAVRNETSLAWLNVGQSLITNTMMAGAMIFTVWGWSQGRFTPGDVVLVNSLLMQLFRPLDMLGWVYRSIRQGLIDMEAMFDLTDTPAEVAQRMVRMLITGRLQSVDGTEVAVSARSICVHGDTPGAVAMAVAVRKALAEAGVEIRAFAP